MAPVVFMRRVGGGLYLLLCCTIAFSANAQTNGWQAGATAYATAAAYASQGWTCNAANTVASCRPDYVCDWTSGQYVTGVCYDWGGDSTVSDFLSKLGQGWGAGNHAVNSSSVWSGCTTGIDCSALVCKAWGLQRLATSQLSPYVDPAPSGDDGHMGYAWIRYPAQGIYGHIVLIKEACDNGNYVIVEANCCVQKTVVEKEVGSEFTNGFSMVRNKAWIYPDSPLVRCNISGAVVSWVMSDETGVDGYQLMGAMALQGPWTTIGGPVAAGVTSCVVSGTPRHIMLCAVKDAEMVELGIAQPAMALKCASGVVGEPVKPAGNKTVTVPSINGRVGIIAPAAWSAAVGGLQNYWESQFGCDVLVSLLPADWPYFLDVRAMPAGQADVKATIASWWGAGVRYVMLVGDAAYGHQAEGHYDNAIIPPFVEMCTPEEPYILPEYVTDVPYADVDNDDVPDVAIARLPVINESELWSFIDKMEAYNEGAIGASQYVVMSVAADVSGPSMSEAAEYVDYIADGMRTGPLGGATVWEIRESEVVAAEESTIQQAVCDTWSTVWPELVLINAYSSNDANIGHVLSNDMWPFITSEHCAVVLAPTCFGGRYATALSAEHEIAEVGLDRADGPVAWIGPSLGTWEVGNFLFEKYFAEEMFGNPARPMAESYLVAIRRIHAEFPDEPKMINTIRKYHFLGDPLSPFRNRTSVPVSGVPSGGVVAAHLTCRVTPNPFNPRVTIALENPARQQVNVKIHDVRGMLVKSVYSDFADAGRKTLTWDGDDDRGHAVAAGIYLVTVSAGTERTVQKISLVK